MPCSTSDCPPPVRPRYDWYQDDDTLSIVIYEASVRPESICTTFKDGTLSITYSSEERKVDNDTEILTNTHSFQLRLYSPIVDPAGPASDHKLICSKKKIELRLRKINRGYWSNLEFPEKPIMQGPITFSKVEEKYMDTCIPDKGDKDEDGRFLELLQDIYSKGDEDTKRAMLKSFQSSNGEVLSTDWNQVKNDTARKL